ncbi:hypothetical protein F4861DRAFT_544542 [Xylaria intraflava]|nr:hypothetical protein F4861DRAFT_544542 [Xylaria intraflava]
MEGPIEGQIHAVIEPTVAQAVSKIDDKLDNLVRELGLQETLDAHVKWDVEKLSEIIPIVRKIEHYFHKLRDRLREDDADILGEQQDRAKGDQATTHEQRTQPATTTAATFGQPSQPTSMFGPFGQPNLGLGQPGSTNWAAASAEKILWKVNTTGARAPQKKFVELAPIEISDDPPSSDYDYYSDNSGSCEGPVKLSRKQWKGAVAIGQGTMAQGEEQTATRTETEEQDQAAEGDGTSKETEKPKESTLKKMEMNLW